MAIIKQYHKDTNTTYVYESTSYYDEEKHQSRSRRKVIGKIDPETGEMIPTGKRGSKPGKRTLSETDVPVTGETPATESEQKIKELTLTLTQKEKEIKILTEQNKKLLDVIRQISRNNERITAIIKTTE